ncbi:maleylpyruvate isomerase family mycothiol-dependent enzyme [Saccharothrix violaceirubra]|uniref:Uncharacterized protein (TIGR03086 family) n=1 Tax=Saccharothrix violaceirubra TaxID=413306 RepID=A0A7W7WWF3_9PSEU|nr:TIGR03086 family metal-binding protein [Saccharothrix violaceirubra]MBB4966319.1 uncharacterized protein (TIGR03086 family) [Saccharothrix violaceirubra]
MIDGTDLLAVVQQRNGLLERATRYAREVTAQVRYPQLTRPTPCEGWDLWRLLWHVNETVVALREAVESSRVFPEPAPLDPDRADDVLSTFDRESALLLEAWDESADEATVAVGRHSVHGIVLANTGALELAVHGWDIARSCDLPAVIPADLATDLLRLAHAVVPIPRRPQFGPEILCPEQARAGDRLVAFLGRRVEVWCPAREPSVNPR